MEKFKIFNEIDFIVEGLCKYRDCVCFGLPLLALK
jgi:hypothetical protein